MGKYNLSKENMAVELNMRKSQVEAISRSYGIPETQRSRVIICLDHSGSMESLYDDDDVQAILEKILPIAMAWDDNGECEVFRFSNTCERIKPNATENNVFGYVKKNVFERYRMGGTSYSSAIDKIGEFVCGEENNFQSPKQENSSFFSRMFGGNKSNPTSAPAHTPTYVVFITDGECQDERQAEQMIRDYSQFPIFFQFVGIGRTRFNFLEKLDELKGRYIDNAGFFQLNDFNSISTDVLYKRLLKEYPEYLVKAKAKNMF